MTIGLGGLGEVARDVDVERAVLLSDPFFLLDPPQPANMSDTTISAANAATYTWRGGRSMEPAPARRSAVKVPARMQT
jgi:hypothetical protein